MWERPLDMLVSVSVRADERSAAMHMSPFWTPKRIPTEKERIHARRVRAAAAAMRIVDGGWEEEGEKTGERKNEKERDASRRGREVKLFSQRGMPDLLIIQCRRLPTLLSSLACHFVFPFPRMGARPACRDL